MKAKLETILSSLQDATTLEELQASTESLRAHFGGVLHVVYHWVNSVGERFGGAGTYSPPEWVDNYLEKNYLSMDRSCWAVFSASHR